MFLNDPELNISQINFMNFFIKNNAISEKKERRRKQITKEAGLQAYNIGKPKCLPQAQHRHFGCA